MPSAKDLKPGATIYDVNLGRGSFTCFVRHPTEKRVLYGITARHVLTEGSYCTLDNPVTSLGTYVIGGPAKHLSGVDGAYFEIDEDVRKQLTQDNFIPVGCQAEPTQVFDPGKLKAKLALTVKSTDENELKKKEMPVFFVGSTQQSKGQPLTTGTFKKLQSEVVNTQIAKGDSGGCVVDAAKNRYVGLISSAAQGTVSTSGEVVFLKQILDQTGFVLANWADHTHWQ